MVLFNKISGGKVTLAETGAEQYPALVSGIPPLIFAGGIAVVFIIIAIVLPNKNKIS